MLFNSFCTVLLNRSTTPLSFIKLPNIKQPISGAAEGTKYLDFYPDLFESLRRMQGEGGSDLEKQDGWDKYELIFHAQYATHDNGYKLLKEKFPTSCWITDRYVDGQYRGNGENIVPAMLNFIRKASRLYGYNLFPYFRPYLYGAFMLGASASVLAIVAATAYREPNYPIRLLLFGTIRLKYLALIVIGTDLLFVTSNNGGGHIAHLGGALAGLWFAHALTKGTDITAWINKSIDWLTGLFANKPKKPKMKANYGGNRQADYDYNARKKAQNEEVDRILDKLKKSGYENLTSEEKKTLFDASRR